MAEPTGELVQVFKKTFRDELNWLFVLASIIFISLIVVKLIQQNGINYKEAVSYNLYIFALGAAAVSVVILVYWCVRMLFFVNYATIEIYEDGLRIFYRFSFPVLLFRRQPHEAYLWTEINNFDYSEFEWSPPAHVPDFTPRGMPFLNFLDIFGSAFRWRAVNLETVARKLRLHVNNSEIKEFHELLFKLALPVWKEHVLTQLTENKVVKFGSNVSVTKHEVLLAGALLRSGLSIPWGAVLYVKKDKEYLEVTFRSEYEITSRDLSVTGAQRDLFISITEFFKKTSTSVTNS